MLLRWSLAGACIGMVHGSAVYAALNWPQDKVAAGEPPAAVMIELSPVPAAPDTPQQEVALGPQMVMSEAATPSESEDKPVELEQPEPETQAEPVEQAPDTPTPENPQETTSQLPHIQTAVAVLTQSTPPPQETPLKPEKKPEKPKKQERKKPRSQASPNAPATAAPKPLPAPRAATNAAPMAGMSSSASPATWRSMLMAHLNRHKRMPPGGGRGTSQVVFVIDRSGRVMSARLVGSSGHAALDQEAVALARRASPVPPPPPNVGGGSVTLSVPVRFNE
jgi:periplasmic protein TonB